MSTTSPVIDPLVLIKLFQAISSTTNSIELQVLINKHLKDLTKSALVCLIPLLSPEEGLIQVVNSDLLPSEIRFAINGEDIEKITNQHNEPLDIQSLNSEFLEVIEMVVGSTDGNILIYDIRHLKTDFETMNGSLENLDDMLQSTSLSGKWKHDVALLVCLVGENREKYLADVDETFKYALGHLLTAFQLFEEKRVRGQCQDLLRVARHLLGKIGDLGQLLRGVMAEAKILANAERCSLFLIDKYTGELVSKVFDGDETKEVRLENGKGISGKVAESGKLLNIRNAYEHPSFYKGVDEYTGFRTKNILCFPICDSEGAIIGVAQLCNKINGYHFDKCDEEIATAFSVYCGISIMHSLVHKTVQKAEARYKLSQELLLYHMKVPDNDVVTMLNSFKTIEDNTEEFSSFKFCPRDVDGQTAIRLSMKMFADLNFLNEFKIQEDKLARFLLLVQKGYRPTPYHNFQHAFTVAHFAYAGMMNLKLIERGYLTNLQGFVLLISCFCHDLDHRGTNNSYQTQSSSTLARLYSSEGSVNERHHLSQSICILNEPNCKILDRLSTEEFKEAIDLLRDLILATDLANHFRILKDLNLLQLENMTPESNKLFLSLFITCCDLSDQVKSWKTVQQVADLVYAEFFTQGDLERQMGLKPSAMMDRNRACIPALQIEFLTAVVRPAYVILTTLFPEAISLLETIDNNCANWEEMKTPGTSCKCHN